MLDEKILSLLVCPICQGPLYYKKDQNELWCKTNRLAYTIRDGIPVMLVEQARQLDDSEIAAVGK